MATPSKDGIMAEIEHHERQLEKAIKDGNTEMISYHQERIRRLNIELSNLR